MTDTRDLLRNYPKTYQNKRLDRILDAIDGLLVKVRDGGSGEPREEDPFDLAENHQQDAERFDGMS